jgi:hypothetical protein
MRGRAEGGATVGAARRTRGVAACLALLNLGSACVTYVPLRAPAARGATVRVALSDQGRVTHAPVIGPGVQRLTGTVRDEVDSRQSIDVTSVNPIGGQELPVSGIRVTLAPGDLVETRQRVVSRKRTAGMVASALAVVVTFFVTKGFRAGHTPPANTPSSGGRDQ